MSTCSSARNLFPPLDNPELTIRRISRADPTLLNEFKMATEGNGDPPVPDLRTMEELCQPSLNGRVQNFCQFHGLSGDGANKHLDKFLHVTQSIKVNGVIDDALRLYLFPHSLTDHATSWFDRLPRNSINTFEQMTKMSLGKYFPPSMVTKLRNEITNFRQCPDESLFEAWEHYKLSIDRCPNHKMLTVTQIDTLYNGLTLKHCDTINAACGTFMKRCLEECYDLIENMTAHHNDWDTSAQRSESSSYITSSSDQGIVALKAKKAEINKNLIKVLQINQQVKAVTPNYETYGGSHSFNDCPATVGQTQNVYAAGAYQGSGTLPSNTITNPKEDLKGITTRSGTAYQEPTILTTSSSLPKVVEHETEVIEDMVPPTNNRSTKDVQPPKTSIPYTSRFHDQKLRDKTNDQKEKFFKIFHDLNFNISFADALIIMPKFSPSIKSFLTNNDKLFELTRTLLNEHCSAVLLKKLPEKLEDPGKFLILCDCLEMAEFLALADLGASINLMPLFVWNKLSLHGLTPTLMTLELADRSIFRPIGVAEDVYVKVGKFYFPTDFVVVGFDADPQVPVILRRSFLKTERALIDFFEGELTLRVGREAIIFNLDQTSKYSANYNDMTANQIDVIDMACEDYSQEVLVFSDVIARRNPTPYYDPIVSTSSSTLTPFRNSDFLLEEISKNEIEVDKSKVNVIAKLPHLTTVKGIRSFLGHAGFYRRFIQNFSKIARPMTCLLEKDTLFFFSNECIESFQTLKRKLTEAPILITLDWDLPFELICDASDFAIDCGPIESEVKHLLGSVVRAIMSPGGYIMESLENFNGFLAVYTPPDDLIRTNFKQKGVVPEVMLYILEEFVLLLGRHSLNNEIPRMVVCKVGKP
nr:reverse transcriptase domain-containing protein [Tanacetum cinerariifolium]